MMKKFIFVLSMGLIIGLTACGGKKNTDEVDNLETTTEAVNEEVEELSTESTTEESIIEIAEEDTEKVEEEKGSSDDIDPDFKEALDSYEDFMDEYVEFMKKYKDSDDTASMMLDYADYMTKYADFVGKIDGMDQDDMSNEELAYYAEVQARVSKKLAEIN